MAINISESRDNILHFLRNNRVGVLATSDRTGQPHAATVYITHDDDLNLYFVTKEQTAKSRDLQTNPQAAIAIYDPTNQTTVQAEGKVEEIIDIAESERILYEVWMTALQTSDSGTIPISKLRAGGYIAYKLKAKALRLASFNADGDKANIFETVPTNQ